MRHLARFHRRFVGFPPGDFDRAPGSDVVQSDFRETVAAVRPRQRRGATGKTRQEERQHMVSGVVLLKVVRGQINEVASELAALDGITEVYSVGGRYDLVAILRVRDNEALAALVTEHMLKVQGITESETLIAFRAFSRHDLESMFSLGLDE
jgi:DNA-binding Lrp family transcriptional regulator